MPREAFPDQSGVVAEVTFGDHHLQVATLHTDEPSFVAWCRLIVEQHDTRNKLAAGQTVTTNSSSRIEIDALEGAPDPLAVQHLNDRTRLYDGTSMGMFWTPERYEVQALIKALRRGRDRVWGADE